MAMSVNPKNEGTLSFAMGHCAPAAMIRPRSTVPIRACGHHVPRQQAGHMTARYSACQSREKSLQAGGHPHMTNENWPLIGPLNTDGAFVLGALSGFGTMAACAAGELCAGSIAGGSLPAYAEKLGLGRYGDKPLMATLNAAASKGVL